jgi:hypothetical protein
VACLGLMALARKSAGRRLLRTHVVSLERWEEVQTATQILRKRHKACFEDVVNHAGGDTVQTLFRINHIEFVAYSEGIHPCRTSACICMMSKITIQIYQPTLFSYQLTTVLNAWLQENWSAGRSASAVFAFFSPIELHMHGPLRP